MLIPLLIYLFVPTLGFVLFIGLNVTLNKRFPANFSTPSLFLIFFLYGGWLEVVLTSLFWYWSAMASLGCAFLILISPGIIAYKQYAARHVSAYHKWMFRFSAGYFIVVPAIILVVISISK